MNKESWQKSYSTSLKSYKEIRSYFDLKEDIDLNYDVFIPLNFAEKIRLAGKDSSLWKQFVPLIIENSSDGLIDPIGDKKKSQGMGIIKRYNNRILFTPTINCPIICRYCFRKNELSNNDEIFKNDLSKLVTYLDSSPEIEEVILTGGDPLILSDEKILKIANLIAKTNVKYLRFHTRTPIILPNRIDDNFVKTLNSITKLFKRVIFVLHTNHPDEIDSEVTSSLKKLNNISRLELKTQSVLLKGINNKKDILKNLIRKILDSGFTPYYLHHPDQARGAMHFWLPLEEGRKIYNELRVDIPGWAIPHYIIDHQSGQGKQLAFNPETFSFSGKLLNIKNETNSLSSL